MKNIYLNKLKEKLSHLYCYFKDDNILAISEDKTTLPFALVIHDKENYKEYLLLSLATDYPNCEYAVEVALWANKILPTVLSEPFFISSDGTTYTGNDARSQWNLETLPLDKMESPSKSFH